MGLEEPVTASPPQVRFRPLSSTAATNIQVCHTVVYPPMQRDMGGPKGSGALLSIKELCSEDNRREVDAGSASNIDDPERRDRVSQSL